MSKVFSKETMFLREKIGDVEGGDAGGYSLEFLLAGCPLVRSKKTGQCFCLSWQDLVEQAVAAGVDVPLTVKQEEEQRKERTEPKKRGHPG